MASEIAIAIGSDHRGYNLKQFLISAITNTDNKHVIWMDIGAYNADRSDYPNFAVQACNMIIRHTASCGILLCGTGTGMAIVANRFSHIYAAVAWNSQVARLSREDDNSNVLVIPADYVTVDEVVPLVQAWLGAQFKGGRYQERIKMIDAIK